MGEMHRLAVTIEQDLADEIERAVESGEYPNDNEAVRAALLVWRRFRATRALETERLQAMLDEGFASGSPVEATDTFYEDIKKRGRARLARSRGAE